MDYTPIHRIPLIQNDQHFKMNSDTTALMKAMHIKEGDRVLDIGTNQGVLLLEAAQYHPKWMVGIDINSEAIELAYQNMQLNHIENVTLIPRDIQDVRFEESFDVILSNPPFFEVNAHTSSSHEGKQRAKFTQTLDLNKLMKAIKLHLSNKGRAYIVFRSAFIAQCFTSASHHQLSITRLQGVEDTRLHHYKSCILTLQHGQNKPCQFDPPIVL
jgi:tRNA1(Val) A37 N6-methylase TrmN6